MLSALFVSLTLFLGSGLDLYYTLWWWDMLLHAGSGFLFGIVGLPAIYILNETKRISRTIKPRFVFLFAVSFAVLVGVAWEILEYVMDLIAPSLNMQSRETGVHDTMHDLIVDLTGAIVVAAMGWAYTRSGRYSFIANSIRGFVSRNPPAVSQEQLSAGKSINEHVAMIRVIDRCEGKARQVIRH